MCAKRDENDKSKIEKITKASKKIAKRIIDKSWENVLKHYYAAKFKAYLGKRSIGIFGDYTKKGDGWTRIEYLARLLAREKRYRVLTGKGIFYPTDKGVHFNEFLFNPSPHLVSYKKYSEWLVSLVPKAIILLGPYSSTVEDEEKEAGRLGIPTCGVAILEKISQASDNCSRLEVYPTNLSFCMDGIGLCEENRFCPFAERGLPGGRLDLYCRNEEMRLLAVPKQERILDGLKFIAFV